MNDRLAPTRARQSHGSAESGAPDPALPGAASPHSGAFWGVLFLMALAIAGLWYLYRTKTNRAWRTFAAGVGGEFRPRSPLSPDVLTATIRGRGYMLETATSHEDDAPYYHTKASIPIKNPSGLVLGLRRKSMLEEAQSRADAPADELNDAEFSRRFFLISNHSQVAAEALPADARRELGRYHDVEVYVRLGTLEWRRAGEVNSLDCLRRLTDVILEMGERIDRMPARARTLSERLADEELIRKGV